ncbi:MAG: sulfurtransferase-like selenium metabolism protein YedF [Eubacteriales bacterium]
MITVDAMGQACPMPVIMTKKAMASVEGAEVFEVLVDNEIAVQNVTKMATSQGGIAETVVISEAEYKVRIIVGDVKESNEVLTDVAEAALPIKDNTVMVFESDRMGIGNDELGKVLIKGFIFAVTQLENLPKTMLFYNGGATLTSVGSDSLEDLKHLQEEGVEILTCGTCLNYYNMSDKLVVGDVTNMYTIVEKMDGASKIIKP